ncbi:hypothetical protein [Pseudomonas sp. 6D_7.1_Bac1]|uniref:hypothetical protein n=1 Tax=Pseudomonas sp. 6D_7.1_Bac1 TaxID=2971615 RepID=UPI0021C6DA25|nr:hypothetical protein [Pseudomonas sp. 6D_7.1_Bac1]MCU1748518.1 hypothetical protein [Pseudomonas sp. 6D_7.1_Bac1]
MFSRSKLPSTLLATGMAALLLGNVALPSTAQASIELSSDSPSYSDKVTAIHSFNGKDMLVKTDLSIDDLVNLQKIVKANTAEMENLKKTVSEQAHLIDELKRNNGASSNSSTSELSSLKKTLGEQERDLSSLGKQVEELKRNNGASSSSNSSEASDLKRTLSEQARELNNLGKQVEELKRNTGSSSSSSSSELSSLKRDVDNQNSELTNLKRSVEDLSRKVK